MTLSSPLTETCADAKPAMLIKYLPSADYSETHAAMSARTLERIEQAKAGYVTADELWIVEHNDVYTLGQAGKESHILRQTDTPIIQTDRGGQVTWHGQGQLVVYWLFDLKGLSWGVRDLVSHAEQAIEDIINQHLQAATHLSTSLYAKARRDAPGVYLYSPLETFPKDGFPVNDLPSSEFFTTDFPSTDSIMLGKIASLGFKIKHGMSYHGIAINLTCDLSAFLAINPCGYAGMTMLRLSDFLPVNTTQFTEDLIQNIIQRRNRALKLRIDN